MAKQTIVQLIDDISGESLDGGAGRTVQFSFDGTSYEIDLSHGNAAEFQQLLQRYIDAGRRVAAGRRSASPKSSGADVAAVRAWAQENGYKVSSRGRIKADVLDAYRQR